MMREHLRSQNATPLLVFDESYWNSLCMTRGAAYRYCEIHFVKSDISPHPLFS